MLLQDGLKNQIVIKLESFWSSSRTKAYCGDTYLSKSPKALFLSL